jgi:hypothetical protein
MSVVPELREALVRAAEREAAAARPRPAWRRHAGGLGVALAGAVALVVVAVVIVLAAGGGRPGGPAPAAGDRSVAAQSAARALLARFARLPGAVAVAGDPSTPSGSLGAPPTELAVDHVVDLHRFYVVHAAYPGVIEAFLRIAQPPPSARASVAARDASGAGFSATTRGAGAGVSAIGGGGGPVYEALSVDLPPSGPTRQLIAIQVAAARGGGTAVRIDAQAGWDDPPSSTAAAQAQAEQLLGELRLPTGARPPGVPDLRRFPHLRAPGFALHEPHTLTLTRFWRVPGAPVRAVASISVPEVEPSYGQTAAERTSWTSSAIDFAAVNGISRQVSEVAVAVPGGASLVRVDVEVGWQDPRPAGALLPAGVDRLTVLEPDDMVTHLGVPRRLGITDPAQVRQVTSAIDALPLRTPPGLPCSAPSSPEILGVQFFRTGSELPVATARVDLVCGIVYWMVGPHREPALDWLPPDASRAQASLGQRLTSILTGGPHNAAAQTGGQSTTTATSSAAAGSIRSG